MDNGEEINTCVSVRRPKVKAPNWKVQDFINTLGIPFSRTLPGCYY